MNVDDPVFICPDCGIDAWDFQEDGVRVHEDFYVHHELWMRVCPDDECHDVGNGCREGKFIICIGCFEKRLGRRLTRGDFRGPPRDLFGTPPSRRFCQRYYT